MPRAAHITHPTTAQGRYAVLSASWTSSCRSAPAGGLKPCREDPAGCSGGSERSRCGCGMAIGPVVLGASPPAPSKASADAAHPFACSDAGAAGQACTRKGLATPWRPPAHAAADPMSPLIVTHDGRLAMHGIACSMAASRRPLAWAVRGWRARAGEQWRGACCCSAAVRMLLPVALGRRRGCCAVLMLTAQVKVQRHAVALCQGAAQP